GIFTNPTFDYEVCFVAGTPVLMADGSRRAIETLRPGDLVLAADQLNPESAPAPAKVVRFFDNGEKTVVRLRFEGQELVCTPEHPFYVLGKGWVRAEELVEGDLCLNAAGERVAFVSREEIAEKLHVYNIEVEGAHTYFVGDDDGVLAHNKCDNCHGVGMIEVDGYLQPCPKCCIIPSVNDDNRRTNISNLLEAGYSMPYILAPYSMGTPQEEYKLIVSRLNFSEKFHFVARAVLNDYPSMLSVDLKPLSEQSLKDQTDAGDSAHAFFLGERWTLLSSFLSKLHSSTGTGKDCFKWCSDSGRELVIQLKDGKPILAIGRNEIGTFNVISPVLTAEEELSIGGLLNKPIRKVDHFVIDILPYAYYNIIINLNYKGPDGNVMDETTMWLRKHGINANIFTRIIYPSLYNDQNVNHEYQRSQYQGTDSYFFWR
ncbi:MAG: hypothetical protein IJL92_02970, partial [Thermoguttaceae bacterium]|nr:hypothetical protein [Thermoguttaceae bacterium]